MVLAEHLKKCFARGRAGWREQVNKGNKLIKILLKVSLKSN